MKSFKNYLKIKKKHTRVSAVNPSGSIISKPVLLFLLETCPFV